MEIERIIKLMSEQFDKNSGSNGNKVFVFSNLLKLKFNREYHRKLVECFNKNFSTVTFLFPAYTYNSRSRLDFNPNQAPSSQCGSLSRVVHEDFRGEILRTYDEDYSYLVLNHQNLSPRSIQNFTEWRTSSFGKESHHEALFTEPGYFLIIADEMDSGFTPAMHCEALVGVEYREMIEIPSVLYPNRMKNYYSRREDKFEHFGKRHRKKALKLLEARGKLSHITHSTGHLTYLFSTNSFLEEVTQSLILNRNFFLGESHC